MSEPNKSFDESDLTEMDLRDKFLDTVYREKIYQEFCLESNNRHVDSIENIYTRIQSLDLKGLTREAKIVVDGKSGQMLYDDIETYIGKYALTDNEIDNARKIEVYVKTFAYQFVNSTIESGNCRPDNWYKLASYIWTRIDRQLGGIEKMQSIIDSSSESEASLLDELLKSIRNTQDLEKWENAIQDSYFKLKKAVLVNTSLKVNTDPEWTIHKKVDADSTYYADLLNDRVLALWRLTEWNEQFVKPIQYLRSDIGEDVCASWCRPDADPRDDRGKESCYYFISGDGIAVVREFNECLFLSNEQDLHATAMTIIQDVMGDVDMEVLSNSFYTKILNRPMEDEINEFISGSVTREQIINAMVNEWIVDCYCSPDEGDDPPEVKRAEFEAMSSKELLEQLNFDEEYTVEQYLEQYEQIADGYMKAFNPSVDDLKVATEKDRSFIDRTVDILRRIKNKF